MRYFVLRSDGIYVIFDGMTQEAIIAMLQNQGQTCQFIEESDMPVVNRG